MNSDKLEAEFRRWVSLPLPSRLSYPCTYLSFHLIRSVQWAVADTNLDFKITAAEFVLFFSKLLQFLEPHYSQQQLFQVARAEWNDYIEGMGSLDYAHFYRFALSQTRCCRVLSFSRSLFIMQIPLD